MIRDICFASALLLATAIAPPALAGDSGAEVMFSQHEIQLIKAWYQDHDQHFSHSDKDGKSKKIKALPPGIAKNLARGKPLPPGIAKQRLPGGLIAALPPAPQGYERVVVDDRVLLVEIATQMVRDVLLR